MAAGRKKAVSLRLSASDLTKIRRVARRLDVRDSDVIRFAIKNLLVRLSPLTDPTLAGSALVPLFLEAGSELTNGLELDAEQLDRIINEGVDPAQRVSLDDLHMIAMVGAPAGEGTQAKGADRRASPMRRYLYEKYLFRSEASPETPTGETSAEE
ncbi:MAG: hypothetical protein IT480_00680 [Gammaproteobacteria bacterium]|nr:hypothetical protein [Gammaproteobacteria bacterium]